MFLSRAVFGCWWKGCASITVGEDETATSASSKTAADYLRSKGATAPPPTIITEGAV